MTDLNKYFHFRWNGYYVQHACPHTVPLVNPSAYPKQTPPRNRGRKESSWEPWVWRTGCFAISGCSLPWDSETVSIILSETTILVFLFCWQIHCVVIPPFRSYRGRALIQFSLGNWLIDFGWTVPSKMLFFPFQLRSKDWMEGKSLKCLFQIIPTSLSEFLLAIGILKSGDRIHMNGSLKDGWLHSRNRFLLLISLPFIPICELH